MSLSAAGNLKAFGSPARRQPILHLGATPEGGLGERIGDGTAHSDVSAAQSAEAALNAWYDLETQFNSVCIGLIVEPGPAIAAVARILIQGCSGEPLPGAIALVGYDAELAATCLRIAPAVSIEWPPMMIFLPSDDPALADCARMCRRMRAAGIAISLDVMGALQSRPDGDVEAVTPELARELESFFDTNLTPYFPKLL